MNHKQLVDKYTPYALCVGIIIWTVLELGITGFLKYMIVVTGMHIGAFFFLSYKKVLIPFLTESHEVTWERRAYLIKSYFLFFLGISVIGMGGGTFLNIIVRNQLMHNISLTFLCMLVLYYLLIRILAKIEKIPADAPVIRRLRGPYRAAYSIVVFMEKDTKGRYESVIFRTDSLESYHRQLKITVALAKSQGYDCVLSTMQNTIYIHYCVVRLSELDLNHNGLFIEAANRFNT